MRRLPPHRRFAATRATPERGGTLAPAEAVFPPVPMQAALPAATGEAGLLTLDSMRRVAYVSPTTRAGFLLAPPEKLVGKKLGEVLGGAVRALLESSCDLVQNTQTGTVWEVFYPPCGAWYEFHAHPIGGEAISVSFHEVTARHQRALIRETDRFFALSSDLCCILTPDGLISRANPAWERLMGYSPALLTGTRLVELIHPGDVEATERALLGSFARSPETPLHFSSRCRHANGMHRWLDWSAAVSPEENGLLYATARDVTEARETEAATQWKANHDALTSLPNRALLMDRLGRAIAGAQRQRAALAVLFLDLDRFKPINDTLGHAAGDALLKLVAERLSEGLRDEDTVARLGGDEFVIILPAVRTSADALAVADKMLQRITRPFSVSDQDLFITGSIGVSLYPRDGQTPEDLIRNADLAMYHAKSDGRSRAALHKESTNQEARDKIALQSHLSQAIERHELSLHYQPQVSLQNGALFGVEALMRWNQTEMGAISPATFIPLAEETGLIQGLGTWAFCEACRQAAQWQKAGFSLKVGVNVSAHQLEDRAFPDNLARCFAETGIDARQVELELTESTFIRHDPAALDTLVRLKEMGLRLSVDDFGTGYSSLSYLRSFPIDGVKVDRSFIKNLVHNSADEAVVRAVIDLSHTLGMKVIAEGVETADQRDKLQDMGCDAMQGYLFSAALAPLDVTRLLTSRSERNRL